MSVPILPSCQELTLEELQPFHVLQPWGHQWPWWSCPASLGTAFMPALGPGAFPSADTHLSWDIMPKMGQNTSAETLPMLRITGGLHHLSINVNSVYISLYIFLFCNSTVLSTNAELGFYYRPQNFLQQDKKPSHSLCCVYCCWILTHCRMLYIPVLNSYLFSKRLF